MLLTAARLMAIAVAVVVEEGWRKMLDWHDQRGLSFYLTGGQLQGWIFNYSLILVSFFTPSSTFNLDF
jgi:hypothetical membrane protein